MQVDAFLSFTIAVILLLAGKIVTTTLVSSAGSQKTGASGGGTSGSTGKSQPPALPDPFGQRLGVSMVGN